MPNQQEEGIYLPGEGNLKPISVNPYSASTTYEIEGHSHEKGGVPIIVNNKKIEAEGGETIRFSHTGDAVVDGNMYIPNRELTEKILDMLGLDMIENGFNKKFKDRHKEIAKEETRVIKSLEKKIDDRSGVSAYNPFIDVYESTLDVHSSIANDKLKNYAEEKEKLGLLQDAMQKIGEVLHIEKKDFHKKKNSKKILNFLYDAERGEIESYMPNSDMSVEEFEEGGTIEKDGKEFTIEELTPKEKELTDEMIQKIQVVGEKELEQLGEIHSLPEPNPIKNTGLSMFQDFVNSSIKNPKVKYDGSSSFSGTKTVQDGDYTLVLPDDLADNAIAKDIFNELIKQNEENGNVLTPIAIAGIMANIKREMNFNRQFLVEHGNGAYGLVGWRSTRWTRAKKYMSKNNHKLDSIPGQVAAIFNEILNTEEKKVVPSINKAKTAEEAARIFYKDFERSEDPDEVLINQDRNAARFLKFTPKKTTEVATVINPTFDEALNKMIEDAKKQGIIIERGSGFRTEQDQKNIIDHNLKLPGRTGSYEKGVYKRDPVDGKMKQYVASVGGSYHQKGYATDLKYKSKGAAAWAHKNAKKYGLHFPLGHEDYHIELIGVRNESKYGGTYIDEFWGGGLVNAPNGITVPSVTIAPYKHEKRKIKYNTNVFTPEEIELYNQGLIGYSGNVSPEAISNFHIQTTQPINENQLYGTVGMPNAQASNQFYNYYTGNQYDFTKPESVTDFQRYYNQIGDRWKGGFYDDGTYRRVDGQSGLYTNTRALPIQTIDVTKEEYEALKNKGMDVNTVDGTQRLLSYSEFKDRELDPNIMYKMRLRDEIEMLPLQPPTSTINTDIPKISTQPLTFGIPNEVDLEPVEPSPEKEKNNFWAGVKKFAGRPTPPKLSLTGALDALLFWDKPQLAPTQQYNPLLKQNTYIDYQADRNEIQGSINEISRMIQNNPSALGALYANAYQQKQRVNQQERNVNEQNRQTVYNQNVDLANQASQINMNLADLAMQRNFTAMDMAKQNNRYLLSTILQNARQDRLNEKTLDVYQRVTPNIDIRTGKIQNVEKFVTPSVYDAQIKRELLDYKKSHLRGLGKKEAVEKIKEENPELTDSEAEKIYDNATEIEQEESRDSEERERREKKRKDEEDRREKERLHRERLNNSGKSSNKYGSLIQRFNKTNKYNL